MTTRRPKMTFRPAAIFLFAAALTASAQLQYAPSSASTQLYFAQLADGGPATQKWAVTLILDNPSATVSSVVSVTFFDDAGHPLPLDFGQGPTSTLKVTLPPGGSSSFTSLGASSTTHQGWALATATNPITGTVLYRATNNGTPIWDVAAAGTGPTYLYNSFANYNLGIALLNPSATQTINLLVSPRDSNGANEAAIPFILTPNTHTAVNLGQPGGLPLDFTGSIVITSVDNPPTQFVAWALNSRDGLLSPLPPGELRFPSSYQRRANDVFAQIASAQVAVVAAIAASGGTIEDPSVYAQQVAALKLSIDLGSTITASVPGDGKVHVSTALLEALGDSRSALGFLLGHMVALAVGGASNDSGDPSIAQATDTLGILSVIQAGYDPGGPADLFARLQFAQIEGVPVSSSLMSEFSGASDARMQQIFADVQQGCMISAFGQVCQAAHSVWHPQYPSQVP